MDKKTAKVIANQIKKDLSGRRMWQIDDPEIEKEIMKKMVNTILQKK